MKSIKTIQLVLFSFLFQINIYSQIPNIQWQKSFGGTDDENAYSICLLPDSNYIIVGSANSNNGNVNNHYPILPGFPHSDIWLIKIDNLGNLVFNKCLGGTDFESGNSIVSTKANELVLTGYTSSRDGDAVGLHGSDNDCWLIKTNGVGNILWQRCLGGTESDEANQIIVTKDSGYFVVGEAGSNNGDLAATAFHGSKDVCVFKISENGVKQWAKLLGGTQLDIGSSCQQTNDGGYLIAGSTNSNNGDVSGFHVSSFADLWVTKLDSSGNLIWQKCFGGTGDDFANEILVTNDDGAIILGTTSSNDGDVTGLIGSTDLWLFRIDSIGNILWQKCLGSIYNEQAKSISKTSDGGFVIVEDVMFDNGMISGTHGSVDYWVCKVDSLGNFEWGKALGGAHDEHPYSIKETLDGGYIVAGSTTSLNTGDVTSNHGSKDFWIVKLSPPGLRIFELENTLMELNIYQNHDNLFLSFFSKEIEKDKLNFYDINGKLILEKIIFINEGINYNSINCTGLAKGIYFVSIGGKIGKKIVVN